LKPVSPILLFHIIENMSKQQQPKQTAPLANTMISSDSALASQYQKKTDIEHVLDAPDTYIGSVQPVNSEQWVFEDATGKIVQKDIHYVAGLYKLFDEAIVNARDHVVRMIQSTAENKKIVTQITVDVSQEDGTITIMNDGNGIDIAKHPEYNVWIPELIFANMRTSTNYAKDEKRIVGGKNGFGFKLVLIWSTYGKIETVDHTRGLRYVQEYHANLAKIDEPVVTKAAASVKPFTKVTFKPDYARMGIVGGLSADMFSLLKKRTMDIAAVTDHSAKKIVVKWNGVPTPVTKFQQYIDLYVGGKDEDGGKRVYEEANERWEYAVALSASHEFQSVSFVNGIATTKGGKHVDYIIYQITSKLMNLIEKKKKMKVSLTSIKEQLILFLRCDIENPAFDSQTKDYLNTPSNKFGSSCQVSDAFIEKVAKMGVMDVACALSEAKENRLAKRTDGTKTKTIRGIANLNDANFSGTSQSAKCTLILCEGLSAMSGIVSGLSSEDRNIIGIYPLKGKLLNVRGEATKKIAENKEIADIKKILGLETGREYNTIEDVHRSLRYGKVMIMTDQDLDGSHIKGLCINLFHSEWASLVKIPGFLSFMNTPILRAKRGTQTLLFYHDGEYAAWKDSIGAQAAAGWNIKYFKGLGTSTSTEFKEYFANKKIVDFTYSSTASDDAIDRVFNKKRPDDRKVWLENYDKTAYLDTSRPSVVYEEFIDREMIHFSKYDCDRSIPNMVDGLKTSLRKILFSAFKRRLTQEIKVAQFSGYVSEHSAYHHGEASLNGAIVNMAQNFVGSNNINLLLPNGQFGTRLLGGDDSASERYIFTMLNPMTRALFPEVDDAILTYLTDDGTPVEPEYYVPIIPFALMNGISGIGTGFSCDIPSFNPKDIISYLQRKLTRAADADTDFVPYYEGFTGTVRRLTDTQYLICGKYEHTEQADTIRITELPIGTWTMKYITFLEELMDPNVVDKKGVKVPVSLKDMTSVSTDITVDITVVFPKGRLAELEAQRDPTRGLNGVHKLLKLATTVSTTNMHMFDADCRLHKYANVKEIIDAFYLVRMEAYRKRKAYQVDAMEKLLVRLSNRARYIQEVLEDIIDLRKKTAAVVDTLLESRGFQKIEGDYKYLIKMPMDSVTTENVEKIMREKAETERELGVLKATSLEQIWMGELVTLEQEYAKYKVIREKLQMPEQKEAKAVKKRTVVKGK
jgi:DNA topoisomerase II